MSDCCASTPKTDAQACPQCGAACKSVRMRTLYHQVRYPENLTIADDSYYFCPSRQCPTAYFSNSGHVIPKQHLRSYQAIADNRLCYCFDIDAGIYLYALQTGHAAAIKQFIVERTKSGECACEIRNPSGQCCLGKLKHFEKLHGPAHSG